MSFVAHCRRLKNAGVLGLNERNGDYIMRYNERRFYPLVDDKILCKQRLEACGIPAPRLIARIRTQHEAARLSEVLGALHEFAIKPAHGSGGSGIQVIVARRNRRWVTAGGRLLDVPDIAHFVANILSGMYSLGGQPDEAMIETLIHLHPCYQGFNLTGIPDQRIIVYRGYPVMAMIRLPTRQSDGKANLHQGAVGCGIDLASGRTISAVMHNQPVEEHPDTGAALGGFIIPEWPRMLWMAARCHDAVGLGYMGADIVIDREHGPQILELNARPGLAIQIANRAGLGRRLKAIDRLPADGLSADVRVRRALLLAAAGWAPAAAGKIAERIPPHADELAEPGAARI